MRLTYDKNGTEPKIYDCDFLDNSKCIQKLGQLEDAEQELGIDLVVLIKAISDGVWVKTKNDISKHLTVALKKRHHTKEYWLFYRPYSHVYLKDYGKTWALTREELE